MLAHFAELGGLKKQYRFSAGSEEESCRWRSAFFCVLLGTLSISLIWPSNLNQSLSIKLYPEIKRNSYNYFEGFFHMWYTLRARKDLLKIDQFWVPQCLLEIGHF